MLLLENKRDVSGMFSKAGRISYERHHVFQRKKQIMNPDDEKKKVIPYVNVVEQLVPFEFVTSRKKNSEEN